METVTITIDNDGKPVIETSGFAGPACRDATRELEKALGVVESDKPTPEHHKREVGHVRH